MLRSITGFDWKKSKAHWLLLSKFIHPQSPDDFSKSDIWENVLDEKPSQSIKRFLDEGLLVVADSESMLSYKYTVPDLKKLLEQRGLHISGRKHEMIERLITVDPVGMKNIVAGLKVFQCTKHGKELAERYLLDEKEKRHNVEAQVMDHIKKRMFKEASMTVADYESKQIFPRGMGIDWNNYDPMHDTEKLNTIFSGKPKIVSKLSEEESEILRQGAAMMLLWGKNTAKAWLPSDFTIGIPFDVDTAARMFLFFANYKKTLEQYRSSNVVESVEIFVAQDSCDECKKFVGKRYGVNEAPELPHENCSYEKGCRCVLLPVVVI